MRAQRGWGDIEAEDSAERNGDADCWVWNLEREGAVRAGWRGFGVLSECWCECMVGGRWTISALITKLY